MINSSEISVIVQGAIDRIETKKCLNSLRKYLKGAEIILSTWENSDVEGLDYDVLVCSKDPGAAVFTAGKPIYNNLNRQLLSTQDGLKKANRKYVLKLRTDLILTNNKFLNYFDEYQKRCEEYKLFERKIIIPTLYSRKFFIHPLYYDEKHIPFHPSDFFLFGLNQDIKKYFMETPLVKEPEYSNYFKDKPELAQKRAFDVAWYQYPPEQYFALSCFRRHFSDIKMDDYSDVTPENILQSEIAIVNNFIILEYKQHGIFMNKYRFSKNESMLGELESPGLYHNLMYLKDYKTYCDSKFKIPLRYSLCELLNIEDLIYKLNKHIYRLVDVNSSLLERLEQLISIPYYSLVLVSSAARSMLDLFFKKISSKLVQ